MSLHKPKTSPIVSDCPQQLPNFNLPEGQMAKDCFPKVPDFNLPDACNGTGVGGPVLWSDIQNIPPCIIDCATLTNYVIDIINAHTSSVTADNGLTKTGNNIQLGGTLTKLSTVIDLNDKSFIIGGITPTGDSSSLELGIGLNRLQSYNATSTISSILELSPTDAVVGTRNALSGLNTELQFTQAFGQPILAVDQLNSIGFRYGNNYSGNNTGLNFNPRWIPDQGWNDSAYAPISGSGNYIQNQNAIIQTPATFDISDTGAARGFISKGAFSAVAGVARGNNFTNTLTATANNDVLTAVNINPIFVPGSFTNVDQTALNVNGLTRLTQMVGSRIDLNIGIFNNFLLIGRIAQAGNIRFARSSDGSFTGMIGYSSAGSNSDFGITSIGGSGTIFLEAQPSTGFIDKRFTGTTCSRMFPTGNEVWQNGGTFIDNGFKLDVIGSFRVNHASVNFPLLATNATTDFPLSVDASGIVGRGAATIAGSYILNQTAVAQTANLWINGNGFGSSFRSFKNTDVGPSFVLGTLAGLNRWRIQGINAETGSQTGYNFAIFGASDAGVENITPFLTINRALGFVSLLGGAEALKVGTNTGNPDHTFIGFYPRTATPTIRNGFIGYPSNGSNQLTINNEIVGGILSLVTTGTGGRMQINAESVTQTAPSASSLNQFFTITGYNSSNSSVGFTGVTHLSLIPNGSQIILRTSSGTAATPIASGSGSIFGQFITSGYNTSSAIYNTTSIRGVASEQWTPTAGGSRQEFYTTKNTTLAQVLAMTIDQDQSVKTWGGGEALKVGTNTGLSDFVLMGFYGRAVTPTTRTARIGYLSAGNMQFVIENEISNGNIQLNNTGAGAVASISSNNTIIQPNNAGTQNWRVQYVGGSSELVLNAEGSLTSQVNSPVFIGATYRGTAGAKTFITSGDNMMRISAGTYVSTSGFNRPASLFFVAAENHSAIANGALIDFYTTLNGTITQVRNLRLDHNGSLIHSGNRTGTAVNGLGVDSTGKLVNMAVESILTVSNGLTRTGNNITLGGNFGSTGPPYDIDLNGQNNNSYFQVTTAKNDWSQDALFSISPTKIDINHSGITRDAQITLDSTNARMFWTNPAGGAKTELVLGDVGVILTDSISSIGLRNAASYAANNTGANYNARWIPDQGWNDSVYIKKQNVGVAVADGSAALTYTFAHNAGFTPTGVIVTSNSTDASGYIKAEISGSSIIVTYATGRTIGISNLTWSYLVF
jgi:hypothetical protein